MQSCNSTRPCDPTPPCGPTRPCDLARLCGLMRPCDLAVTISALACCIAEGKSADELALISSIFSQLGDTLDTIAAQQALCAPKED